VTWYLKLNNISLIWINVLFAEGREKKPEY